MKRVFFVTLLYLLAAFALEVAVLPQFFVFAPPWLGGLFEVSLMALGGILLGL